MRENHAPNHPMLKHSNCTGIVVTVNDIKPFGIEHAQSLRHIGLFTTLPPQTRSFLPTRVDAATVNSKTDYGADEDAISSIRNLFGNS